MKENCGKSCVELGKKIVFFSLSLFVCFLYIYKTYMHMCLCVCVCVLRMNNKF